MKGGDAALCGTLLACSPERRGTGRRSRTNEWTPGTSSRGRTTPGRSWPEARAGPARHGPDPGLCRERCSHLQRGEARRPSSASVPCQLRVSAVSGLPGRVGREPPGTVVTPHFAPHTSKCHVTVTRVLLPGPSRRRGFAGPGNRARSVPSIVPIGSSLSWQYRQPPLPGAPWGSPIRWREPGDAETAVGQASAGHPGPPPRSRRGGGR